MTRRTNFSKKDEMRIKKIGDKLRKEISRHYKSEYDFWINSASDYISRSSLNDILKGKREPRITTLYSIAESLNLDIREIL